MSSAKKVTLFPFTVGMAQLLHKYTNYKQKIMGRGKTRRWDLKNDQFSIFKLELNKYRNVVLMYTFQTTSAIYTSGWILLGLDNLICTGILPANRQLERANRVPICLLTNLVQWCMSTTVQRTIGMLPFHLLFETHPWLDENAEIRELLQKE